MSKILKNNTDSLVDISDTGVTVPASGQYLVQSTEYLHFATSSDIVSLVGDETLTVNDGSNDLNISDGIDLIKDIFPTAINIRGATDNANIGNINDAMKVYAVNDSNNGGTEITFPSSAKDAFGRLRVSEQVTLLEYSSGINLGFSRYMAKKEVGNATITLASSNNPSTALNVTTASGDKAIIQTRRRVEYNKGHSQLIYIVGKLASGETNLIQRIGYFCNTHGIFFEYNGTTMYAVVRSSVSGSVVDTKIAQSNWNIDTLDGNGPSGLTATWDERQTIFVMDFGWLSALGVRYYIVIGGETVLVHQQYYSNQLSVPYMDSGMAPIRLEIETTGSISSSKTMTLTCASVKTEGKPMQFGKLRVVDTATGVVTVPKRGNIVAAGIKLKNNAIKGSMQPISFNILPTSGNGFLYYTVIYNPTLSGDTWMDGSGIHQVLTNNPTWSGGSIINSGYLAMGNKNHISTGLDANINPDLYIGSDIDENPDAIVIVFYGIASASDVLFSGAFREFY